jgi:signal transduction histidine kinase
MLNDLWGDGHNARAVRLVLLLAFAWSALAQGAPSSGARAAAFSVALAAAVGPWLAWTVVPRRVPMTLAGLTFVAVAGGSIGAFQDRGDISSALFTVLTVAAATERLPLRAAGVVGFASLLALLISAAAQRSPTTALLAVAMPAAGFVTGLARHQYVLRAEQAELLLAEVQRTREEQARAAALDERVRIAREVHDVLAHSLAALAIQLEVAEALLVDGGDVEGATQRVRRSRQLAVDGLDETRRAVAALREDDDHPLPEALERLVASYREESGGEARLEVVGNPSELAADVRLALQRIAREALTNVRKHAPDAAVETTLSYADGVCLRIVSRGAVRSAPLSPTGGGYGIAGMRERAALIGAQVSAGPVEGGWQVEARVPG